MKILFRILTLTFLTVISISGVRGFPLINEPVSQPSGFSATGILTWNFTVSWTAANPVCDGYLVVRTANNTPTGIPVDGVSYSVGDALGNGKVAYSGSLTSFIQKGVIGSQNYRYLIYAFNGIGAGRDYLQLNPLNGTVTTPQTGEGVYYQNIDPNQPTFVTDLQSRIRNPYTHIDYALFDETNVADFAFIDTTGGQRAAVCVYTGQRVSYNLPFSWTPNTPFSREHTWCASWMPSSPNSLADEYSDQHHLFVTNQNNANGVRGNHPLDEVVSITSSFLEGKFGLNAAGDQVYEPRESHKGNAARALLYMALKYHGVNGMDWSFNHLNQSILPSQNETPQSLSVLLQWNAMDPPDAEEISRNDYIQSIQQNRNPFIDHPWWVSYIDFNTMQYQNGTGISENQSHVVPALMIYPSPTADIATVSTFGIKSDKAEIRVTDLAGRTISVSQLDCENATCQSGLNTILWPDGMYLISVKSSDMVLQRTLIVQH